MHTGKEANLRQTESKKEDYNHFQNVLKVLWRFVTDFSQVRFSSVGTHVVYKRPFGLQNSPYIRWYYVNINYVIYVYAFQAYIPK